MPINASERLIVALDVPHDLKNPDSMIDVDDARVIVRMLGDAVFFLKIGWPLYMAGGQTLIPEFVEQGKHVFLDLKFGDIAETVKRLVHVAVKGRVKFITVNTSFDAIKAAVEAAKGSDLKILTVTLLTSLDERDLRDMGFDTSVKDFVVKKAMLAKEVGCHGVIASGREAAAIRREAGKEFLIVTPGIRPAGTPHEDHKRAVTPAEAINAGADYLVVGRPIVRSRNPRDAALAIVREMQTAFNARA